MRTGCSSSTFGSGWCSPSAIGISKRREQTGRPWRRPAQIAVVDRARLYRREPADHRPSRCRRAPKHGRPAPQAAVRFAAAGRVLAARPRLAGGRLLSPQHLRPAPTAAWARQPVPADEHERPARPARRSAATHGSASSSNGRSCRRPTWSATAAASMSRSATPAMARAAGRGWRVRRSCRPRRRNARKTSTTAVRIHNCAVMSTRGAHLVHGDRGSRRAGACSRGCLRPAFASVLDRIDSKLESGGIDATLPDGSRRRLGFHGPGPSSPAASSTAGSLWSASPFPARSAGTRRGSSANGHRRTRCLCSSCSASTPFPWASSAAPRVPRAG